MVTEHFKVYFRESIIKSQYNSILASELGLADFLLENPTTLRMTSQDGINDVLCFLSHTFPVESIKMVERITQYTPEWFRYEN